MHFISLCFGYSTLHLLWIFQWPWWKDFCFILLSAVIVSYIHLFYHQKVLHLTDGRKTWHWECGYATETRRTSSILDGSTKTSHWDSTSQRQVRISSLFIQQIFLAIRSSLFSLSCYILKSQTLTKTRRILILLRRYIFWCAKRRRLSKVEKNDGLIH